VGRVLALGRFCRCRGGRLVGDLRVQRGHVDAFCCCVIWAQQMMMMF
jgi:hypothetical protein